MAKWRPDLRLGAEKMPPLRPRCETFGQRWDHVQRWTNVGQTLVGPLKGSDPTVP